MTYSLDVTPCILVDRLVLEEHAASFFRVEQQRLFDPENEGTILL
jgi:hypothetical protein